MFCYQCGTQLEEGSLFCHNCGAKMPDGNVSENQNASNISAESDRTWKNDNSSQYDKDADMQSSQIGSENDENKYGENIKPYYRKQFDRIASGQKAQFNWAALFLNAWMQLYNGCTGIFCKTFLPFLIVNFGASFIGLLARINYNHTLTVVSSALGIVAGIYGSIMCIVNGFCFNKWYYQDVINNPGKKRSRKGLWFLIVAEIAIVVILQLTGRLVAKHVMESFDDYYDESDDDLDNDLNDDFYEDSYGDSDDDSIDDADEDLLVEHSEDLVSIQGENIEDSMIDTAQYEESAREIITEWFSRHPLQHNFRIVFMNETADTEDGSGIYLNYEMYWDDDEWYGSFYVNPASGDMIMDSMITATGITTVQEPMDQWYLEDYWFLGEDLGGYSELYEDDIYFLYNGYNEDGNPILEYYAENDSYRICDYDGQCLIEYDDGSETSETSIIDFAGTYAYDGSFEADDRAIDFYYLLEIGEWDGYSFSIAETWRGNMLIQDEYARAKSLIVDTLTFDIYNPDVGYETHSLTYVPANESTLGKDVIYLDGDNTMPFVRE